MPLLQRIDERIAASDSPSLQAASLDLLRAMAQITVRKLAEGSFTLRQLNSRVMTRVGRDRSSGESAGKECAEMHLG